LPRCEKGKALYIEHALSKWYETFWSKPNNKIAQAWPKADNIISFKAGYYNLNGALAVCHFCEVVSTFLVAFKKQRRVASKSSYGFSYFEKLPPCHTGP
jgi:hypothetical protein